jgi:hypothetical protein
MSSALLQKACLRVKNLKRALSIENSREQCLKINPIDMLLQTKIDFKK